MKARKPGLQALYMRFSALVDDEASNYEYTLLMLCLNIHD